MTRYLLLGMGGGYDIYGAMPLYWQLVKNGHHVTLANISFTDDIHLYCGCDPDHVFYTSITGNEPLTKKNKHWFPEYQLARYLKKPIVTIRLVGPHRLYHILQTLVIGHKIDTVIAVDQGFDAFLMGDELVEKRGSPLEDSCSMLALYWLNQKLHVPIVLACISVTTETSMDLDLFYKHWFQLKKQARCITHPVGLVREWFIPSDIYAKKMKHLLDQTTTSENRSIPAECLLAALQGHRNYRHFINPRLAERITEYKHFPPVTHDTHCYFMIDLPWFFQQSFYYTWLNKLVKQQKVHDDEFDIDYPKPLNDLVDLHPLIEQVPKYDATWFESETN
jgi:hypothetical protein